MAHTHTKVASVFFVLVLLVAGIFPASYGLLAQVQPPAKPTSTEPDPTVPKRDLANAERYRVVSIADGDTITVARGDKTEKLRLIGVDSPETKDPRKDVQYYGKEASEFLTNLLRGEEVYVITETKSAKDKYGRTLAHVYRAPDGLWVNLELIRQGYAQVYSGEVFEDINLFLAYQRKARESAKGLWDLSRKPESERKPAVIPVPAPNSTKLSEKAAEDVKPTPAKLTVYVTRSGTKYHRQGCSYLRSSSIPIDLSEAKSR